MVSTELNAVVAQRIEVAPGLMVLRVVPDGWALPEFLPGQFGVLGLPGEAPRVHFSDPEDEAPKAGKLLRRAYSIASSSMAGEYVEFFITLVHSGALTPRLFALDPGARVFLSPKITGLFTLKEVPPEQNVVLVATGTGLAPYMSMLRTQFACGAVQRFAVLLGARHSWDLGYRSELITIRRMCGNFAYLPIISRPAEELAPWSGASGYVQDLWRGDQLQSAWGFRPAANNTHVFLCGNPSMIEGMVDILQADGFVEHTSKQPGQIHVERYW